MTLFERLRDAPAVCMIPLQGGVGTPTVGLTDRERAAVLNLIEAAQEARRWMATDDRYGRYAAAKFDEALAPFLSGQEEPK